MYISMKRNHLLCLLAAGASALSLTSYTGGPYFGGAGNRTGSAGTTAGCYNSAGGCHGMNNAATTLSIGLFTGNTPVTAYVPGQTYRVVLAAVNTSGRPKFGFQVSCVKTTATSQQAGSLSASASQNITVQTNVSPGNLQLVEHNTPHTGTAIAGTANVGDTVSFNWTAPGAGTGKVTFYGVLNAVNANNGADVNDQPNVDTLQVDESLSQSVGRKRSFISVKTFPNPATNILNVDLSETGIGIYHFEIFDFGGRKVATKNVTTSGPTKIYPLQIGMLPKGCYVLVVSKDGILEAVPFRKI